jgi:hypothetical protein
LSGYSFDLNGDGVREHFVHTGECGADGDPNMLVLQIDGDRAEIIAAIQGSFGLIEREGDWADIVEFNFSGPAYRAKTGLRFDGGSYKRIWRIEQPDADSSPIKIDQGGAGQPATRPESKSKSEDNDKPQPESEGHSR